MGSYIPELELPENQFKPPSRDDLLAAGSALVRRSLQAPDHRPQACQSTGPLQYEHNEHGIMNGMQLNPAKLEVLLVATHGQRLRASS